MSNPLPPSQYDDFEHDDVPRKSKPYDADLYDGGMTVRGMPAPDHMPESASDPTAPNPAAGDPYGQVQVQVQLQQPIPQPQYQQPDYRQQPPYEQRYATPQYGLQVAQPVYEVPRKPKANRPRRMTFMLGCLGLLMGMFVATICAATVGGLLVWNVISRQIADQLTEEFGPTGTVATGLPGKVFQTTYIYDRDGNELHQLFGEGRRTQVKLADMSKSVIDATIAVEDSTFYDNPGFDVNAVLRAGLNYFRAGGGGGASTITQQLVRNVVFDPEYRAERSARRKLEEVAMAFVLTRQRTKDEILEMYLNVIYYGNLAYGIEAAAQTYFNKSAKDLTLAEAALLAGLPQVPGQLDPLNPDPDIQEAVFARRNVVLNLMVDKGKITRAQANQAKAEALNYANPNVGLKSPHFTLYAEEELQELLSGINLPADTLSTGGLRVYTSLDSRFQTLAETVARTQIAAIRERNQARNAAVIVLHPQTGEILAMVGSVDYRDDSIDGRVNVTISARQPGSSIKPLTYAGLLERGYAPASVFWDTPQKIGVPGNFYEPVNYDGSFRGPVRMRDALANSYNIPAVQAVRLLGVDGLLSFSARMGIESLGMDASLYGVSLTLGGGEVTPLELTRAYSVFANGGKLMPSTSILCVINNDGDILYQFADGCQGRGATNDSTINVAPNGKQIIDPRVAYLIRDFLGDNNARSAAMGANSPLRTDGILSSVKTGTTNNYKDNWTVGFTSNVAVGVWVGNTRGEAMVRSTGLTGAAPIWNGVITGIYRDNALLSRLERNGALASDTVNAPDGLTLQDICALSSLRDPVPDCDRGRREWAFTTPPYAPNENGDLVPSAATAAPVPSDDAPVSEDIDPGVVRMLVNRLDVNIAAAISAQDLSNAAQYGTLPPPPLYCIVPNKFRDQTPGAQVQAFIKAPEFPDENVFARQFAASNGLAISPDLICGAEMLAPGNYGPGITAQISAPANGETVTGTVYVSGVVGWSDAWFYKMEITGPQFPDWTTFSGPSDPNNAGRYGSPQNGILGDFGAAGLIPGTYRLRIVVVGRDGNYAGTSPEVSINVTGG